MEHKKEKVKLGGEYSGPTNLTEYLFAGRYGEISEDIDPKEIDMIYMAYMKSLVDSYERLKAKFNQF